MIIDVKHENPNVIDPHRYVGDRSRDRSSKLIWSTATSTEAEDTLRPLVSMRLE